MDYPENIHSENRNMNQPIAVESTSHSDSIPIRMGDSLIEVPSFERFKEKLHIELLADVRGHTLEKLSANLSSDENWHLGIVARAYGFPTFETLLLSPQLSDIVILSKERRNGREVMIYKGAQLPEIDHITRQMTVTDGDVQQKQVIEAEQKVLRATLAQYDPTCMKGKTQIFKILFELGGNPKELGGQPIQYQKVQERYEQVYNTKLNSDELKKYFKKTKAQSVFEQLCFEEVTVFNDQQQPGSMFLQLKKPFEELESDWKSKAEIQCAGYNHINAMKLTLQQQLEEELRNKRPKKESKCNLATRNLVPTISGIPTNMVMSKHLDASDPSMNPFLLPDSAFGTKDFLPISQPEIDKVDNKPAQQWTSVGDGEYTDEEDFAAPPANLVKKTRPSEMPKTDLVIKENELSFDFIQPKNTSPSNVTLNSDLHHEPKANVKHAEETENQMKKSSMTRVMKMAMQHVREMDQRSQSRNQRASMASRTTLRSHEPAHPHYDYMPTRMPLSYGQQDQIKENFPVMSLNYMSYDLSDRWQRLAYLLTSNVVATSTEIQCLNKFLDAIMIVLGQEYVEPPNWFQFICEYCPELECHVQGAYIYVGYKAHVLC